MLKAKSSEKFLSKNLQNYDLLGALEIGVYEDETETPTWIRNEAAVKGLPSAVRSPQKLKISSSKYQTLCDLLEKIE